MDKTGRKRLPLGPVSPSSVPSGQRRRCTPTLSNGSQRSVSNNTKTSNNENKDPNSQPSLISQTDGSTNNFGFYSKSQFNPNKHVASSQLSGTSNVIENSQTYLTPSQRRLSFVNLNGNHDPFVSHTTSQITESKHGVAPNSSGCVNISGNGQDYLTPSQRRLRSVNLSGITTSGPVSCAIQRKPTTTTNVSPFQLPASRISPTKNFLNKIPNPYMTDSSNFRGSVIKDTRIVNLLNRHSMDRNHCITSASNSGNDCLSDITVLTPELEQLGVRRPGWFPLQKASGVKNLMESFDAVRCSNPSSNPRNAEYATSASVSKNQRKKQAKHMEKEPNSDTDNSEIIHENIEGNGEKIQTDDIDFENEAQEGRGQYVLDEEDDPGISQADLWNGYMDLGPPTKVCRKCKSVMWNEERNNKGSKNSQPTFSLCCRDGQVVLDEEKQPPPYLASLLAGGEKTSHFLKNIRTYNSMFQFTSIGGKIDKKINNGKGPYCFKLNGQNYHLIGTLKPNEGETPKFCQLYIYDTENEVQNRMNAINGSDQLDPEIIQCLLEMLDEHNKCARGFRMARDRLKLDEQDEFNLKLLHSRSASGRTNHVIESNDVAALIVGDADDCSPFRDIVVQTKQMYLKRVFETCSQFMSLQYPLLFPYGDEGFHPEIPLQSKSTKVPAPMSSDECPDENKSRTTISMREYYAYKLMIRPDQGMTMHLGGRLWQQFVVDAFAAVEQYRLDWIKTHQHVIRSDLYRSIRDRIHRGDTDSSNVGQNVILPATFTGSQRYMNQYFKDSLAICRSIGHPSLFLTMTCNTQWPEIQELLKHKPGVDVTNAPDIIARVFKLKLDQLIDLIKKKKYFGRCIGIMHVIEFQKRGLPHTHMLIWLHPNDRPKRIDQIDDLISAEIPDHKVDPIGYNIVKKFMIHGPCGNDNMGSSCMVKGKCIRHFPKRFNPTTFFDDCGFPQYRRRRQNNIVTRKRVDLDNQFVVPYNKDLLIRFHCHINLEVCNSSRSLKYLFKYCLKGHDTATMILQKKDNSVSGSANTLKKMNNNEIKQYLDGRYVCAVEAAWRLFGFDIHHRFPAVERLPVHCPGEKNVTFNTKENLQDIVDKASSKCSKLEGWFIANKTLVGAKEYTYMEFPQYYTWKADQGKWKEREKGTVVGRIIDIHTSAGETFFLRMLLMHVKGATSFEDLRTVNGKVYNTFKEACDALGLLKDDRQWHVALQENALSAMPRQLRELFVHILTNNTVADPLKLLTENWKIMSEDIVYNRRRLTNNSTLHLTNNEIQNWSLAEIEKLLNDVGKSLKDYSTLPFPDPLYLGNNENCLIAEETGYAKEEMKLEHARLFSNLNEDQLAAYNSISESIDQGKGGLYFVYGSGGCGKTFLWKTLCCRLRMKGQIVLPVASSGIAATLLPGGMNFHHHLASLGVTRTDWILKVRVTRMWPSMSQGTVIMQNMIVLDCENRHMHVMVTPQLWNEVGNVLNEGGLYEIVNVRVRPATGVFRPVNSINCLHFMQTTTVEQLLDDNFIIPMHKFELVPLPIIEEMLNTSHQESLPLHSTDVIGIMEHVQPLHTYETRYGPREVVRFTITDGRKSYDVSFYGPLDANTQQLYDVNFDHLMVLILASTRIKKYRDKISISNLPSSRIYVNIDHEDVFLMRQRFINQGDWFPVHGP